MKQAQNLVSFNLSQNDVGGACAGAWESVCALLGSSSDESEWVHSESLEELKLSSNNLTNRHMDELAEAIKKCARSRLQRIDLSLNKIGVKGLLNLLQGLRANMHMKISHLNLDKANLVEGTL